MIDVATHDELTFGPFTLSPDERRLTRDGVAVALAARALDILTVLATRPSEPVGKRELMAEVWPDVIVGEASLRFHVANLRKALGDGKNGARYIATLSGRGYCFVAPVSRPPRRPAPPLAYPWTGNLPSRPPLIGRDDELVDIAELLGDERLVTIVGAGGVGKTRLAIAAAWRVADDYVDGVWLVDLAPLSEPSLVVSAVATALDLARGALQLSPALIASALVDRSVLLILDNCEYLVEAAAGLAGALIERVPGLTILATSQERLRLDAERVYRLDPLALPPPEAANIAGFGSAELFAHRARAADRRFRLDEANTGAVSDICRRLDGMPLSLEMAAARIPSLGVEGLRASLEARLQVFSAGLRTSDVRHQTLRSMVEWTVGLLDDSESSVFRRLGIFAGGFSLEAAMAVAREDEMDRWTVAETLARLVDKSAVSMEEREPPRYRLLETLRLYSRELLEAAGERDRLAESHARHYCHVFAPAAGDWQVTADPDWQLTYMPELDNLRSALEWSLAEPARFDVALELAASAGFIWHAWGLFDEGSRILAQVLGTLDDDASSVSVAEVLRYAGDLHFASRAHDEARRLFERSAAMSRELGDDLGLSMAKVSLTGVTLRTRPIAEAAALIQGVPEALSAGGFKRAQCAAINQRGQIRLAEQDFDAAVDDFTSAANLARQLKDRRREQTIVGNVALAAFSLGDTERAIEMGRDTVSLARPLPYRHQLALALENLAMYLVAADRLVEARPVAEEGLLLVPVRPESPTLLRHLQQWALIAALEGQSVVPAKLIGWVDNAYEHTDVPRNMWEAKSYERLFSVLKSRLSETELGALAAEGAQWDVEEAVNFTLDRIIHEC